MGERGRKIPEKVLQAARYLAMAQRVPGWSGDTCVGESQEDMDVRVREIRETTQTGLGQYERAVDVDELPRTQ